MSRAVRGSNILVGNKSLIMDYKTETVMRWLTKRPVDYGTTGMNTQINSGISKRQTVAYSCQAMDNYENKKGIDRERYYSFDYCAFIDDKKGDY